MDRDPHMQAGRLPGDREAGVALIATLLILALLLALAVAMTTSVVSDTQLRGAYNRATGGFYAAESGLDAGMGGYRTDFLQFKVPNSANGDFNARTITVGNRTVTYNLADRNPTPGKPTTVAVPYGQMFGGLNAQQYVYTVLSSAVNTQGDTEASVGAEFDVGYIPLFQFVAFYNNDLEINPGKPMTLNGRIHTNGNLYLGPDDNLTIAPATGSTYVQVTAGGDIERGRHDTTQCNTIPTLQVSNASNVPKTLSCIGSSTAVVPAATLANWGGTLQSHITSINVPQPSILQRGGTDNYWSNANLRIALILNTKWTIPSGSSYPHKIAVLDSSGNIDTAKQTALENFIFQNPAPSASNFTNTRPIFYTDAPLNSNYCTSWTCTCTNARPDLCSTTPFPGAPIETCYCPNFQIPYRADGTAVMTASQRVYASVMNSPGRVPTPTRAADTDPRRGGFYNWRERRWTYLLNVNVHDLLQWNIDQGGPFFSPSIRPDATGGIVLYLTVYDANYPTTNPSPNLSPDASSTSFGFGVRVFGSQTLPFPSLSSLGNDPTGITIASDRALYVQGNYNAPTGVGGVYNPTTGWQPSSIVGDVVNVMSSNYFQPAAPAGTCTNDCQSNRDLSDPSRNALATTINAAFLAGVDTTTGSDGSGYNGGLENYPRFHEDWNTIAFNYLGSFVSLGTPSTVTGRWCGTGGAYAGGALTSSCNIYNPPSRTWNFDPNFQNAAYLPPYTPRFVYVQQIRFTENFQ